jgi:hypothetical protein
MLTTALSAPLRRRRKCLIRFPAHRTSNIPTLDNARQGCAGSARQKAPLQQRVIPTRLRPDSLSQRAPPKRHLRTDKPGLCLSPANDNRQGGEVFQPGGLKGTSRRVKRACERHPRIGFEKPRTPAAGARRFHRQTDDEQGWPFNAHSHPMFLSPAVAVRPVFLGFGGGARGTRAHRPAIPLQAFGLATEPNVIPNKQSA